MADKKKYDSTLARMAGNIAGAIAGHVVQWGSLESEPIQDQVARLSVEIAERIIEKISKEDSIGSPSV